MENPFKKLFGDQPGEENQAEVKKVVDVRFDSHDGQMVWTEKYEDGSENPVFHTEYVDMANVGAVQERMKEIRESLGLESEAEAAA